MLNPMNLMKKAFDQEHVNFSEESVEDKGTKFELNDLGSNLKE